MKNKRERRCSQENDAPLHVMKLVLASHNIRAQLVTTTEDYTLKQLDW